ncbi:YheC/D-like protein [Acinetobacter calcoaceticus]|uniref:YheC/D-like protein n=1 Tax=Acinetobacter calcoaceticus TaxID=471 RepID=A0A4R1X9W1_ACICA|nr:YheC/D-like protein [Acinetobacter calcoaceticus]
MKVGYLRFDERPGIKAKALAYMSFYNDIDFFYFRPEDVDLLNKTISGLFLVNNEWERKITSFPNIIDNAPSRPRDRAIYQEIKKISPMITYRIGDKEKVFQLLKKDVNYTQYLIDSDILSSIDIYLKYIDKFKTVIIKPKGGNMGKGIYKSYISDNRYVFQTDIDYEEFDNIEDVEIFLKDFMDTNQIQQYIDSNTIEGHPYDIRLHVQRGKGGNWKIVKIYPRIGLSQKVTSNLSQGGGISNLNSFLKSQFGDQSEYIRTELRNLAINLPKDFQKNYSYTLDALGIDVGIDSENNLKIFEINTYPGSNFLDLESAIVRVEYYKYLLTK